CYRVGDVGVAALAQLPGVGALGHFIGALDDTGVHSWGVLAHHPDERLDGSGSGVSAAAETHQPGAYPRLWYGRVRARVLPLLRQLCAHLPSLRLGRRATAEVSTAPACVPRVPARPPGRRGRPVRGGIPARARSIRPAPVGDTPRRRYRPWPGRRPVRPPVPRGAPRTRTIPASRCRTRAGSPRAAPAVGACRPYGPRSGSSPAPPPVVRRRENPVP